MYVVVEEYMQKRQEMLEIRVNKVMHKYRHLYVIL
jgi:hypothetical protein